MTRQNEQIEKEGKAMAKKVVISEFVSYSGHNVSANGVVNLTLLAKYGELTNTIQAMQLLNEDIKMKARLGSSKPMLLGTFRIKNIMVDGDGESKIKLASTRDAVELDNINALPFSNEDNSEFMIRMEATVEEADETESESETEGE